MNIDYNKLNFLMDMLIDRIDQLLPSSDIIYAKDLIEHGEYGISLEHIWTQIYEYNIIIDEQVFELISNCADIMHISKDQYEFIIELICPKND